MDQSNDLNIIDPWIDPGKRLAVIKYSSTTSEWKIKNLSEECGTFALLSQPCSISDSTLISFSDSHVAVEVDESLMIKVEFVQGPMCG
jgi:hypothetical protein